MLIITNYYTTRMAGLESSISIDLLLDERPRHPPDTTSAPGTTTSPSGNPPGGPPEGSNHDNHQGNLTPKGYSKTVLVGAVPPKVICVYCDHVLRDPVQSQCGHRYCRACYVSAVESEPGVYCVACTREGEGDNERASLTLTGIIPDHAIRRDMANMDAKCENTGCDWIGTFGKFLQHETECSYQKVKCDCNLMVCSNNMADHKNRECLLRNIKCMYCGQGVIARDKDQHEQTCEFFPEICDGCRLKMPRHQMKAHIDPLRGDCKNRKCPFNCEAIYTPHHQREQVVEHLNVLFEKVVTLNTQVKDAVRRPQNINTDLLTQKMGDLEIKVTEIGRQVHSFEEGHRRSDDDCQGEAGASPADNTSVTALAEKQETVESLVAILNRQLEKVIVEYNGLEQQRRLQDESLDTLQRKVTSLERSVALKDITVAELDPRIQALEKTSFDGTLVWPITDFSRKRQEALSGRTQSIYSPPFYTSRCGYKMCCRAYLNGDGMGKNTHISLFFVVMKIQFDAILSWPFRQKVTMMLLDHSNKDHLIDAFRPDPTSSSFKRPVSDMNIASGCPLFCPLSKLDERKPAYVKDDSIFVKVIVDQTGI